MSDLATLGLRFETQGGEKAVQTLDQVAAKSDQAERATDALSAANRRSGSATAQMLAAINKAVAAIEQLTRAQQATGQVTSGTASSMDRAATATIKYASSFTQISVGTKAAEAGIRDIGAASTQTARQMEQLDAHVQAFRAQAAKLPAIHAAGAAGAKGQTAELVNLSRQFADVAVTGAMGMNPLMIAIQQGPQIADALALMAIRAGGLGAALSGVATAAWAALAPLAPYIAAVGAAAAAVTGFVFWLKAKHQALDNLPLVFSAASNAVRDYEDAVKAAAGASDAFVGSTRAAAEAAKQSALEQIKAIQQVIIAEGAKLDVMRESALASAGDSGGGVALFLPQTTKKITDAQAELTKQVERLNKAQKDLMADDKRRIQNIREETAALALQQKQVGMTASEKLRSDAEAKARNITDDETRRLYLAQANATANAMAAEERRKAGLKDATAAQREHNKELREQAKALKEAADEAEHLAALQYATRLGVGFQPVTLIDKKDWLPVKSFGSMVGSDWFSDPLKNVTERLPEARKGIENIVTPADTAAEALDRLWGAFDNVAWSARDAISAFKSGDWSGAIRSVGDLMAQFKTAFGKNGTFEGKVGAVAGIADMAGQLIGGKAGGALSGAAAGAMAGTSIAPGIGTAIGAVIGGIVGLFGASAAKKRAEEERKQKELERQQQIVQQRIDIEIQKLTLLGNYLALANKLRDEEAKKLDASNRALWEETKNLELAANFREKFGTEEEKLAFIHDNLNDALKTVGLTVEELTRDRFKDLVNQGGQLGAVLLDLVDPFDQYTRAIQDQQAAIAEALAEIGAANVAAAAAGATAILDTFTPGGFGPGAHQARAISASRRREEERKAAEEAAQAWMDLQAALKPTISTALMAGDAFGALDAAMKLTVADPANANYWRDIRANGNTTLNNATVREQARLARELAGSASADALNIQNVGPLMRRLLQTSNLAFSPEFGGSPLDPARTNSFGRGGGYAGVVGATDALQFFQEQIQKVDSRLDDGSLSMAKYTAEWDRWREKINEATAELGKAGAQSLAFYFGRIGDAVTELNAQLKEADAPIARLTESIGRLNSVAQVFTESTRAALVGGGDLANAPKALLIAEAASVAASVLTTADARRAAEQLAKTGAFAGSSAADLRSAGLLLDGLQADDVNGFERALLRANDALIKNTINEDQYRAVVNQALDTFEGLDKAASGASKALQDLADSLKLDDQLSALSIPERLAEAQRQFAIEKNDTTARNLAELLQLTSTGEADYRTKFDALVNSLQAPTGGGSARLSLDTSALEDKVGSLQDEIRDLKAALEAIAINTRKTASTLDAAQNGNIPLTTTPAI